MTALAFRIVKEARAWWPVAWDGLAEDGSAVKNRIELRFRQMKTDAAAAFGVEVAEARAKEAVPGTDLPALYVALVMKMADDWRLVAAENGETLPFTVENVRLLMNEFGLFGHVFEAFRDCLARRRETREGN